MIICSEHFDIKKIAESGQCFRINMLSDDSCYLIHGDKVLGVTMNNKEEIELDCSEDEYGEIWSDYFDMNTDYNKIVSLADKEDIFLNNAIEYGRGIRILKQDPWEMIISFIISQRKSIPAIRTSIERLSRLCGQKIENPYCECYAFPTASQIISLSDEEMSSCGLGYRSAYVRNAAEKMACGEIDVYSWNSLSDEKLRENLLSLYGVGEKVAGCVMLFGYHRLDAFPEDVWIKRALQAEYPNGFPFDAYKGYGGIMQQYIFFYYRNMSKQK